MPDFLPELNLHIFIYNNKCGLCQRGKFSKDMVILPFISGLNKPPAYFAPFGRCKLVAPLYKYNIIHNLSIRFFINANEDDV